MVQQQFCNPGITITHQNYFFWSPLETVILNTFQIILGRPPHVFATYCLPRVDVQPLRRVVSLAEVDLKVDAN